MSSSQPNHSGSQGFTYKSWGTNSQGNHYCSRDYGINVANPNSYHYSNRDGSYYYSNPNGSTYCKCCALGPFQSTVEQH